jgi:hypothetical protein
METKKYLGQIKRYDRMIMNKMEEIRNLRATIYGMPSFSGGERVQISGTKDIVGSGAPKIADLEAEIRTLARKREEIVRQIEKIPDTDMYDVLAKRFILDKDFKVIGVEIKKSKRQTFSIYDNAIDSFEKMFGYLYLVE